jgi:hypothetical protein
MSIVFFEGKNSAGIKKLHMIPHPAATFDPKLSLMPVITYTDDISCTENWETIQPSINTARFTETQSNAGSNAYSYQIDLILNKDRADILQAINDKAGIKLLVLVEDQNGNIRLLGNDVSGCYLSFQNTKDAQLTGTNLYSVSISCQLPHPAPYYTGAFTAQ